MRAMQLTLYLYPRTWSASTDPLSRFCTINTHSFMRDISRLAKKSRNNYMSLQQQQRPMHNCISINAGDDATPNFPPRVPIAFSLSLTHTLYTQKESQAKGGGSTNIRASVRERRRKPRAPNFPHALSIAPLALPTPSQVYMRCIRNPKSGGKRDDERERGRKSSQWWLVFVCCRPWGPDIILCARTQRYIVPPPPPLSFLI